MIRQILVAAILIGLLPACVSRGCLGCAAETSPHATVPAGPAAGFDLLITDTDRAVTVKSGQRLEVILHARPGMSDWGRVNVDDYTVLREVPTGITAARGVTIAGYEAARPGTATIRATATPLSLAGSGLPGVRHAL